MAKQKSFYAHWQRTKIEARWEGTHKRAYKGTSYSTRGAKWPNTEHLQAYVEAVRFGHGGYTWQIWRGYERKASALLAQGTSTSEAGARAAVVRRVKPLVEALEAKYPIELREGEHTDPERYSRESAEEHEQWIKGLRKGREVDELYGPRAE